MLSRVGLGEWRSKLASGLETRIGEGAAVGVSSGERQLLCLARALLERKEIMIFDEVTARGDERADEIFREITEQELKGTTVLTVTHKLASIMHYDRVGVMEGGALVEIGRPVDLLLANRGDRRVTRRGPFARLVQAAGMLQAEKLLQMAKH